MKPKSLRAEVFPIVEGRLAPLGFRKRKGILIRELSDDVLGLVGLNAASKSPGMLDINPVIGVKNLTIERALSEIMGKDYAGLPAFDASTNVGYLRPDPQYWYFSFTRDTPHESAVDEIVEAVRLYGIPFMEANVPLPVLLETMQTPRRAIDFIAAYRIPLAMCLLGRRADAETFVDKEVARLGDRVDMAAEEFRRFADGFRIWVKTV